MGLGGNPVGPAGTGKTESVKALGGLFGRQVLVFNCDEVKYLIFIHDSSINLCLGYRYEINDTNIRWFGQMRRVGMF
jgi:hypothetical protein